MFKYLKLTPAFEHWNRNVPISQQGDWRSYQAYRVRVDQLLCFINILWPEFIEKDDFVLRRDGLPKDWQQFIQESQASNWSRSDIEYAINHIHLADLFANDPDLDQIDDEVLIFLADTIADMWRCRLRNLYPEKNFAVGVAGEKFDPEIYAYVIQDS